MAIVTIMVTGLSKTLARQFIGIEKRQIMGTHTGNLGLGYAIVMGLVWRKAQRKPCDGFLCQLNKVILLGSAVWAIATVMGLA